MAIQKGVVDTVNAARPEGTHCSASTTPPFPTRNSRNPTISAAAQDSSFLVVDPLKRAHKQSNEPAVKKRTAAIRNGGIVSMAYRIARYVEPQIK